MITAARGAQRFLCIAAALALASLAPPPAARAGTVQVILGGSDPTPAPVVAKPHKRKPAAAPVSNEAPDPLVINVGLEAAQPQAAQDVALPRAAAAPLAGDNAVVRQAMAYLGVPYVWGGASPSGFDCSGFVQYVFRMTGRSVPRTADVQFAYGTPVATPEPGDLVFFQTYDWGASHVGIYLGNGYFINAIRPNVHVSSFASPYFRSRYLGARRFV